MAKPRRFIAKNSPRDASAQRELPLGKQALAQSSQVSKVVFQLKSELHRFQQRDREWKLMFSMLSHDLKEPLLTLEGFTKLLEDETLEAKERKRYLKIVREAVHSLHLLVGSLQSVARLYQEPQDLADVSLNDLLQTVETALAKQFAQTKGKLILPKVNILVRADPVRLFQVFLNLIANSLKYHRKSIAPEIVVAYRKTGDHTRISIRDNGIGIDPKDLEKIFHPFTRLEEASTDGLGIGLSIVKRIAESFGGRVTVRSQQNVGTTFTVHLPRRRGA